ncbi:MULTISPECIES: DoxX family protein [Streptomyces]|uniref:DoxX family protein n=2 Tax=Streptomyces TaxID=1883 RepID=A0ABV9IM36_9ACTN
MSHDIGMLVIRLALGLMLVAHGSNKVFGPGGLGGTTGWFESLGLRPAWLHARLAAATEIAAGVLLALGLLTGPACTAYVGLMAVAALTDHRGKGYFVFKGGSEYVLLVGLVAVGVACVGPGAWSLDDALGIETAGGWWPVAAVVAGAGAALGLLATSYRPPPAS